MSNLTKDLSKRLVSSLFFISFIAVLLSFAYVKFFYILVVLSVSIISLVATYELVNIFKIKTKSFEKNVLIFSPLVIVSFFLSAVNGMFFKLPLILFFIFILVIFLKHFSSLKNSIIEVSTAFFSLAYISLPLGMLIYIFYSIREPNLVDGRMWVAIILVLTKISDIFGYFFGKIFGRKKLIKKVSPNKTWEGSIAGLFATVLSAVAVQYFFPYSFSNYIVAIIMGILTALLSQIGDLSESLLKRDAKVKDSSKIPGIGGVLDSLDSLLFTIPFYYIWLS